MRNIAIGLGRLCFGSFESEKTEVVKRSVALAAFAAPLMLLMPLAMMADTTYTYTGNAFKACNNVFLSVSASGCTGDDVKISFDTSLTGLSLDNLSDDDITSSVVNFSMNVDGFGVSLPPLTQANATSYQFIVSTDANGAITEWSVVANTAFSSLFVGGTVEQILSCHVLSNLCIAAGGSIDGVFLGPPTNPSAAIGEISNNPTAWFSTGAVVTPEPPALPLLSLWPLGLLPLGMVRRKRLARSSYRS